MITHPMAQIIPIASAPICWPLSYQAETATSAQQSAIGSQGVISAVRA